MHIEDDGFETPEACVQWCQTRTYDLHVLDDEAEWIWTGGMPT